MTGLPLKCLLLGVCLFHASLCADVLRVATYNLDNYLIGDRYYDGAYRRDYPKPEQEKDALRRQIKKVSPDILAIQEIGGRAYLEELLLDLRMEGLEYAHSCIFEREGEERCLAVISRLPIQGFVCHDDLDFKYFEGREKVKRGLLEVEFGMAEERWTLYNVHLKSRRTTRDEDVESNQRRTREAQAIRDHIRKRENESGSKCLILGDFNASVRSAAMRRFFEISGRRFLSEVPAVDGNGEYWTYFSEYDRRYEQVDYILASDAMFECLRGKRAVIVGGEDSYKASDHRILYVDLEF